MYQRLKIEIPDPDVLISLAPEELAGLLLQILCEQNRHAHLSSELGNLQNSPNGYPKHYSHQIVIAISEAWGWLVSHDLLISDPAQSGEWVIVTRLGKKIVKDDSFIAFQKASSLPRAILHPIIATKAWPNFIRGDYDTAVFQAFKEVEIAVRDAGGFDHRQIGVPLMREAFHKERGPLTDVSLPEAEREALAALFAGAIGSYKNPSSHRTVTIEEPLEAGEMLILASHLLRIVEDRQARNPNVG